jgi:hypothetical protein
MGVEWRNCFRRLDTQLDDAWHGGEAERHAVPVGEASHRIQQIDSRPVDLTDTTEIEDHPCRAHSQNGVNGLAARFGGTGHQ